MSNNQQPYQPFLQKLGIESLNAMQEAAYDTIIDNDEVILLSPTGTGKTLAFLLPLLTTLDVTVNEVQLLILVPSRELAIQIEQVIRELGSGFKTNALYGGRARNKDKSDIKQPPAILIGTPGRIADHFDRKTFSTKYVQNLVLDEFDKSLEVGFETEMKAIVSALPTLKKKVLTSATQKVEIPFFLGLIEPAELDFLDDNNPELTLKKVLCPTNNKLPVLVQLLRMLGNKNGIVFCNYKDTIQTVSDYLTRGEINHSCFYGGLEQQDRERALIKFRNGTHRILIATDLAARGIDVPEMDYIIHFEISSKEDEFTHRNGRTARMNSEGTAYVLLSDRDRQPEFIEEIESMTLQGGSKDTDMLSTDWETLFVSGGRKDKISKGDIAGLFFRQGGLKPNELGLIELKQDCTFVAVAKSRVKFLIKELNNSRLKNKKVRISLLA
jgi:superfamily II DNA/RNA helicase